MRRPEPAAPPSDESPSPEQNISRAAVSESVWYMMVEVAQQGFALLSLPLVLFFVSLEDFGIVTTALVITQVAMSISALGLDFALIRLYLRWSPSEQASLAGRVMGTSIAAALITGALFQIVASGYFSASVAVSLGCWTGLMMAVRAVPLSLLRVTGSLRQYCAIVLFGSALQVAGQVVLLPLGYGATGYMAAYALGILASAAYAASATRTRAHPWRVGVPREIWSCALSSWPTVLGNRLVTVADRVVLGGVQSLDALGVYGFASRLTTPVKLLSGGFKLAVAPALSRADGAELDQHRLFNRFTTIMTSCMLFIGALIALAVWFTHFTPWVERAADLQKLVGLLLVAQFLSGLTFLGQLALLYSTRPHGATVVATVTAASLLLGLVVLVPPFGAIGAAAAQLLSGLSGFVAVVLHDVRERTAITWAAVAGLGVPFLLCVVSPWWLHRPGQLVVLVAAALGYGTLMFVTAKEMIQAGPTRLSFR